MWQPIETAPKDGPRILVWCPADDETGYLAHCEIVLPMHGGLEPDDSNGPMADGIEPTHWMPLPEPPTA